MNIKQILNEIMDIRQKRLMNFPQPAWKRGKE